MQGEVVADGILGKDTEQGKMVKSQKRANAQPHYSNKEADSLLCNWCLLTHSQLNLTEKNFTGYYMHIAVLQRATIMPLNA